MKNIRKLLLLISGLIIFSCSPGDDSNNDDTPQDLLVGLWNLTSIENQGNDIPAFDCQLEQTIFFNANGSGAEKAPEFVTQSPCEYVTNLFNWSRNGDEVTVTANQEGVFINEILFLSEDRLEIVVVEMDGVAVIPAEQEIFKYSK
ncbi:MAG: lipocalin family protein [Psychroserpens sp.]|nr:lipocalin family protein [Psychroserpens sp.]